MSKLHKLLADTRWGHTQPESAEEQIIDMFLQVIKEIKEYDEVLYKRLKDKVKSL